MLKLRKEKSVQYFVKKVLEVREPFNQHSQRTYDQRKLFK